MGKRNKSDLFLKILTVVCALLIALTGILFQQSVFRMIPLYVSLTIGLLQSRASRLAPLLGSLNSLLYAAVYVGFGLYANAAGALLIYFPLQMLTFIRWKKNAYKHTTKFRRLQAKQWVLVVAGLVVGYVIVDLLLRNSGSGYRFWDNSSTILGLVISLLTMLAFWEYTWLMLINGLLTIGLYIAMLRADMAQTTYLIYAIQSFICIIKQYFTVQRLYREQEAEV